MRGCATREVPGFCPRPIIGWLVLVLGCWGMLPFRNDSAKARESPVLEAAGLTPGQSLPRVMLHDDSGHPVPLGGRKSHFTVYLSGCNTCQIFLGKVDRLEELARDFADCNVRFYYLHKGLVHPELRGLLDPYTLRERQLLITQFGTELQSQIPWLADSPEGDLARLWGKSLPNLQLVVDPSGKIVHASEWSDPAALREVLNSLFLGWRTAALSVGTTDWNPPTPLRLADLRPAKAAPPQIDKPLYMPQLQVAAVVDDPNRSYFVKLRVEAERPTLKGKPGKLYLRFDLDPVYRVTWDRVQPIVAAEFRTPEPIPRLLQRLPAAARAVTGSAPAEWLLASPAGREPFEVRFGYRVTDAQGQTSESVQRFVVEWREAPG